MTIHGIIQSLSHQALSTELQAPSVILVETLSSCAKPMEHELTPTNKCSKSHSGDRDTRDPDSTLEKLASDGGPVDHVIPLVI